MEEGIELTDSHSNDNQMQNARVEVDVEIRSPSNEAITVESAQAENVDIVNLVDMNLIEARSDMDTVQSIISHKKALGVIFELDEDELQKLDELLRGKLLRNGELFLQQHENLKISYEKFKIECEQRFLELESDYNQSQTRLKQELENSYLCKNRLTEIGNCLSQIKTY
jgi:hypothetical protein